MNEAILLGPVLVPAIAGVLAILIPNRENKAKEVVSLIATAVTLFLAWSMFGKELSFVVSPWAGFGIDFALRQYNFSAFILLSLSCVAFLISLYASVFMAGKPQLNQFYSYFLLTLAFADGVILSDNLGLMLFFWEGTLLTLFGMIFIGGRESYRTAVKGLIISGVADLCLLFGIGLLGSDLLANTLSMSKIAASPVAATGLGGVAFFLMMVGAIGKAGSMPFHSWIPDAAIDAPLPFMALVPAALEKLVGIYFLARVSLDFFKIEQGSWAGLLMMIVGSITILLAVMMALIQKDFKKLLSYHAISQVGYMILGIGTAVPAGIVGGLFHMINNVIYKCCLFLTGGAVELQTGTTDLKKLGGLAKSMPITFAAFSVAAVSISGVPPFNGFFSKELVYDGALENSWIFYAAAVIGSFFTSASFLKLGHSAFLGEVGESAQGAKDPPIAMIVPMVLLALVCFVFGVYNYFPVGQLIEPIIGETRLAGNHFYGFPHSISLVAVSVVVIVLAVLNHFYGVRKTGKGLGAVDHIHYAPVLKETYDLAEKRYFDPYNIGNEIVYDASQILWAIDRGIDWIYDVFTVSTVQVCSTSLKTLNTGNYSHYLAWFFIGGVFILAFMMNFI